MTGLPKLFLIILGIYFCYQLIIKPFFRIFLHSAIRNLVNDEFEKAQKQRSNTRKTDGSIHVDHMPEKKTKSPSTKNVGGEYIDYEEVK